MSFQSLPFFLLSCRSCRLCHPSQSESSRSELLLSVIGALSQSLHLLIFFSFPPRSQDRNIPFFPRQSRKCLRLLAATGDLPERWPISSFPFPPQRDERPPSFPPPLFFFLCAHSDYPFHVIQESGWLLFVLSRHLAVRLPLPHSA